MKLKFEHYIILGLILIIIVMRACSHPPVQPLPTNTITVEYTIDTIDKEIPVYVPKPYKVITVDSFYKDVDTSAILKDYYSQYHYNDSILGNDLDIYINDVVTKNKIQSRNVKYTSRLKTTTITNTIHVRDSIKPRTQVYYGFGIGAEPLNFNYFGFELLLKTKKDKIYKLGLGSNAYLKPSIQGGMYWKIGKN